MARYLLTLRELGPEISWMLTQQALGMPDAKMQSDFMTDRVAVLMFLSRSLPERLCVTAAVRQMGGTTIFEGEEGGAWRTEISDYQKHMLPIMAYYLDCMYVYGFPLDHWDFSTNPLRFPVINAGSPDAHPTHALADIACMLRLKKELKGVKAAWIGRQNGTLHSLLEAAAFFPFELAISLPPEDSPDLLRDRVKELGVPVSFVNAPRQAVQDASFIFAGKKSEADNAANAEWSISQGLMRAAASDVKLLLSASPVRAIPVDISVLSSPASLLVRQAEYRLRIHKRVLHWVFLAD